MLNTLVSFKSYIGTLFIFIGFIVSFIVLIATLSIPNVKFFMLPITLAFGIALLNCVVYMNEIIKMKEKDFESASYPIHLKSCPEYWIKDVMYIENTDDFSRPKPVNVCKNFEKSKDKEFVTRYVGGSTVKTSADGEPDNSTFFTNFNDHTDSNITTMEESLSNLNYYEDPIESFTSVEPFTDPPIGDESWSNAVGFTRHNEEDSSSDKKVTFLGDEVTDQSSMLTNIPGSHYHHSCDVIYHGNESGGHTDVEGQSYHEHRDTSSDSYLDSYLSSNCTGENTWICESERDKGIIINLDNLNRKLDNEYLCEKSKNFYWIEASNKCDFAGI